MNETVKGFKDYLGEEALKRATIRKIVQNQFELYGFEPAETPIIENRKFVQQGNQNDEAVSDIFKLEDKGKRSLALRYELTFPLKRISLNQKLPYRRYSIGEAFRDEPVAGNRARQFTSCDADIIGSSIKNETEILSLVGSILEKLNIKFTININNRNLLNEILEQEGVKNKEQVIREIDKLDKLSEVEVRQNLKKFKAEKLISIFKKSESYFKKYKSYSEIEELRKYCKLYGIQTKFQPSLARGLSYYNGTIFEVKSSIKETICAGGSYIINGIQGTGFAVSIERLEILAKVGIDNINYLIISINQDKEAIKLAGKLREKGKSTMIIDKISKGLEYANSKKIPYVIFLGKSEIAKKKIKLRDMKTGKEKLISESRL